MPTSLTRCFLTLSACGLPLASAACGQAEDPGDTVAPTVALLGWQYGSSSGTLEPFQGMSGTWQLAVQAADDVGLAKVELLVAGLAAPQAVATAAPWTLTWDTSAAPDGFADLTLRATDAAGNSADSEPLTVYLVNQGQYAGLSDLGTGVLEVPADAPPAVGEHIRFGYDMPAGIHRLVAVVRWEPEADGNTEPWGFTLDLGQGTCPHSGVVYPDGQVTGEASPLVHELTNAGGFPTGPSFAHVTPFLLNLHAGESLTFHVDVYLYE